ncbi:MAG: hypothetical protein ACOCZB_00700 [Spirochaetota bacterium]
MSGAQKISISLLISVVVFSVLAVIASVERFQVLEARFYVPRVEEAVQERAQRVSRLFDEFHTANIERFRRFTNEPAVRSAFRINASAAEIRERRYRLDSIEQERSSLDVVRIIDVAATELHYSSDPDDFTAEGTRRTYLRPDQVDADEPVSLAALAYYETLPEEDALPAGEALPDAEILLEPENNQFIYRLPAVDTAGVLQGVALFYVNTSDLRTTLIRDGLIEPGNAVRVVRSGGALVNAPVRLAADLSNAVNASWADIADLDGRETIATGNGASAQAGDDGQTVAFSYEAFAVESETNGLIVYLEPSSRLEMPQLLKYTLLAGAFLTTFLIAFLVLNVRQDAIVVIKDRVKRFQISLLREYMENRQEIDFRRWKSELEDRRDEVRREIRRGIGRVKPTEEEEVDRLINESWDEIISVLSSRAAERPAVSLDVDRIEEIVNQLSERIAHMNVQAPPQAVAIPQAPEQGATPAPANAAPTPPSEFAGMRPVQVEEVDEIEEVEPAEEVSEAEEAEDVEDAEEVSELEEAPEAEEVEELSEPEELSDAEEVEELIDADDADEAEEADEPEELSEPEGVEELEELIDAEETEEPEEADELEEPGEPEELSDAEELEEVEELSDAEEGEEAEEADELEEPGEPEELSDAEELEELSDAEELEEVEELIDAELEELDEEAEAEDVGELDEAGEPPGEARTGDVTLDTLDEQAELEWLAEQEVPELPQPVFDETEIRANERPALEDETIGEAEEAEEPEEVSYWDETEGLDEVEDAELVEELDEPELVDSVEEIGEPAGRSEVTERARTETGGVPDQEELEELEPEEIGGDPVAPEELPMSPGASTTFGGGFFSFGRGIEIRLPQPQPEEDLEETEELVAAESPDETEADPGGDFRPESDERRDLVRFTDAREGVYPEYEIAPLTEVLDRLHVDRQVLVESEGIVEIGREAYGDRAGLQDPEMRDLVDSVVGEPEEGEGSGIEILFGSGSDELLPGFGGGDDSNRPRRRAIGTSVFRFTEQGFDYDGFLRGYADNEGGVLKSLVRFTRLWNARIGMLYVASEHGLIPSYQLGIDPHCAESLGITKSSGLFRNVLAKRQVLFIKQPLVVVEYFRGLCSSEQLALFERSLLMPTVFRGEPGYALLGMPRSVDSMETAFRSIMPHVSQPQGAAR